MKLVIAEKPSVGMALAKALGVTGKKNGYMEGCGSPVETSERSSEAPTEPTGETDYIISWCVGHLVGLANADSYDERYRKWNIDDLPIIPGSWIFDIAPDKNEQFGVLRSLLNDKRITEVVNACDAGREGDRIRCECDGKPANVASVKSERKTVNPPKLYDLTTLQREANRLYGFTAQQTLDYTQSLYEMKLCTYPRTDSCYLTEDMKDTAESIASIADFK